MKSRNEKILEAIINGTEYTAPLMINSYAVGPDGSAYFESYSAEVTKEG